MALLFDLFSISLDQAFFDSTFQMSYAVIHLLPLSERSSEYHIAGLKPGRWSVHRRRRELLSHLQEHESLFRAFSKMGQ